MTFTKEKGEWDGGGGVVMIQRVYYNHYLSWAFYCCSSWSTSRDLTGQRHPIRSQLHRGITNQIHAGLNHLTEKTAEVHTHTHTRSSILKSHRAPWEDSLLGSVQGCQDHHNDIKSRSRPPPYLQMFLSFNSSQEPSTKSTKLLSQIVRSLEAFQLRPLALSIMLREGETRARGSRSLSVEAPQHRKVCAVRHFEKKDPPPHYRQHYGFQPTWRR